ncbi:hypothetical protein ACOMHN_030342 [Nucella lapillus]
MTAVGDDCYFYYNATCNKGSLCPFRHCEVSRGSETTCSLWQAGVCFRPNCKFRHMYMQTDRSQIPCYWESTPLGCNKPHCAFKHTKPQVLALPPTSTGRGSVPSGNLPLSGQDEGQQNSSSGDSSPIVPPVIIPMEDSDVESGGTASNKGTPVKLGQKPTSLTPSKLASVRRPVSDKFAEKSKQSRRSPASRCESSPPPNRRVSPPPRRQISPPRRQFSPPPRRYDSPSRRRYGSSSPRRYGSSSPRRYGSPSPRRYGSSSPRRYGSPPLRRYGSPPLRRYDSPSPERYTSPLRRQFSPPSRRYDSSPPRRYDSSPPRRYDSPPSRRYGSPSRRQLSPPRRRQDSPSRRRQFSPAPRGQVSPTYARRDAREARTSPVRPRTRPVAERLGGRPSGPDVPSRRSPEADEKSSKADAAAMEILSLEEIHRRRALESMLRAREQKSAQQPKPDPPVEQEAEPQVDCRRVVVDSEEPEEREHTPPPPPGPKKARVSVKDRLGARVSPKKAKPKRKRPAPAALSEEETTLAPVRRKLPAAASPPLDDSDEDLDTVPFRKWKSPVEDPASDSEEETVVVIKKQKLVRPVVAEVVSEEEPVPASRKKRRPVPAVEPEDFSEEEPVPASVKKRKLTPAADSDDFSDEEPISITFTREPEELEPVKVTVKQGPRPLKKLADRIGVRSVEPKQLKKKVPEDASKTGVKPRRLKIGAAEKKTDSPAKLKPLMEVKVKGTFCATTEAIEVKKRVVKDSAAEKKKIVVNDVLAERKRLKKMMADHLRQSAVEKPKRKITLVTDEEKNDVKSPKVLNLEEIRQRKLLKKPVVTGDTSESASDSEKEKSTVPILSLTEIRQCKQLKEARPQPVYDLGLFTDQGGWSSRPAAEDARILTLEEVRRQKQKRQQGQDEGDQGSLKSASKKITPAPVKRSKAELQLYVPPGRKHTIQAASISPPRESLGVKMRLGVLSTIKATTEEKQVKKRLGDLSTTKAQTEEKQIRREGGLSTIKAATEEKQEGGSVGVKTFSEIMAEKKRKKQLERQQKKSNQRDSGSEGANKKPFRLRPVLFGENEEDSLSNSPKRMAVSVLSRSEENASPVNPQSRVTADVDASRDLPSQSASVKRFTFGGDILAGKRDSGSAVVSKDRSSSFRITSITNPPQPLHPSSSGQSLTTETFKFAAESTRTNCVVKPLHHISPMPVLSPSVQSKVSPPSRVVPPVSQPSSMVSQQKAATPVTVVKSSLPPHPQPASVSTASLLPALGAAPSAAAKTSSGFHQSLPSTKPQAVHYRRTSSNPSISHLSETQDDALLTEADAVSLDDTDQLDDLLMDIDSLLE